MILELQVVAIYISCIICETLQNFTCLSQLVKKFPEFYGSPPPVSIPSHINPIHVPIPLLEDPF
jgi:hypothetical protein